MEAFTIRDFSGGLNTATDPSNLPDNMSPYLLNVDLLDSKAIKKRDGYILDTSDPMTGGAVDALYRYYKKNGNKYWVSVCGSGLYVRLAAGTDLSPIVREAEDLTPVSGSGVILTRPWASGGYTVAPVGATPVVYSVPPSTSITVRTNANAVSKASISIDGGTAVLATTQTYTVTGLTATSHTVSIASTARVGGVGRLSADAGGKCGYYKVALDPRSADDFEQSIKFYDDGSDYGGVKFGVAFGTYGSYEDRYHIIRTGASGFYKVSGGLQGGPVDSTVPISTGWHTVTYKAGGHVFLDGAPVFPGVGALPTFEIFLDKTGVTTSTKYAYFDTLTLDSVLLDDFTTISGWTAVAADCSGTYSFSHLTTLAASDQTRLLEIDNIEYSGIPQFTHKATVTASSDTFAMTTLNDKCYISSPYDTLMSYTGATLATVTATNTPAVGFIVQQGRRLFGAGNAADPNKLYYTELDKPEDWGVGTQNGIYLAGQDSGGSCTGLAVWNDLIFYFSESRTYALSVSGLPANWQAKTVSSAHGCVAPKSVAVAPNAVIFLSGDGVRAYGTAENIYSDDGSLLMMLSDNINPSLMAYTDAERKAARGAVYRNRYWLAIADDVYVCDLEKRTKTGQPPWTLYSGFDVNAFCVTRSDEYGLYAGSQTTGHIYHLDIGKSDNGAAIAMRYDTPHFSPRGFTSIKHLKHLHIAAASSAPSLLGISVETDDVSPPNTSVTMTDATDRRPARVLIPGRGRSVAMSFTTAGANQDVTISEITVTYNPRPNVR